MTQNHLNYWLAALYLPGIGPRRFLLWLKNFADIQALFHASSEELVSAGVPIQFISSLKNPNWKCVEADLLWAKTADQHLISYDDEQYPALLKATSDPPLLLYARGNKAALATRQIAIVGSRRATQMGLMNAEQFAYKLAQVGFTITSGLALGIDGACHRGALRAKGITIGVSGTGLKHTYPASHRKLIGEIIANNGAVISEFPLTTLPHAGNFPRRNRIISGLCMGVLVIEAALKSGSLITARCALDEGRDVFAIPGSIHNPLVRGCHHLLRQGAKLVETVEDIVTEFSAFCPAIHHESNTLNDSDLDAQAKQVLEKIEYEITPMDMIILRTRLTASEVSSILLALELKGYIQSVPGG